MRLIECRQFVAMATRNCATANMRFELTKRFYIHEFEMILDCGVRSPHSRGLREERGCWVHKPPHDDSCVARTALHLLAGVSTDGNRVQCCVTFSDQATGLAAVPTCSGPSPPLPGALTAWPNSEACSHHHRPLLTSCRHSFITLRPI
jgi:hypothetical protein